MWSSLFYWALLAELIIFALSFFFDAFACVTYKQRLFVKGLTHLLFSSDKRWKRGSDPATHLAGKKRSKQIVFIRHGESAWNVVFNRGFNASFPGRLISALFEEGRVLPTLDSVFFDSPLSPLGCRQAQELQNFVESNPLLKGAAGKSILVASNLRRAVSTGTIAFLPRLKRTSERIHILSSLQEVTFNFDGLCLAKPQTPPVLSDDEVHALGVHRNEVHAERLLDASLNSGDKIVRGKGIDRMLEFCRWCFARDEPTIITAGHSLYFRFFFQNFLPFASKFDGKVNKMGNAAVVSFTLWESDAGQFAIDEASIAVLHGHFEKSSKKVQ